MHFSKASRSSDERSWYLSIAVLNHGYTWRIPSTKARMDFFSLYVSRKKRRSSCLFNVGSCRMSRHSSSVSNSWFRSSRMSMNSKSLRNSFLKYSKNFLRFKVGLSNGSVDWDLGMAPPPFVQGIIVLVMVQVNWLKRLIPHWFCDQIQESSMACLCQGCAYLSGWYNTHAATSSSRTFLLFLFTITIL